MKNNCILLHPADNVCVLISGVKKGRAVSVSATPRILINAKNIIPEHHKMAIKKIGRGETIIKFGQPIGVSKNNILPGEHVHLHNISFSGKIHFSRELAGKSGMGFSGEEVPGFFNGFLRDDGRAGIRNYIVIVATTNCSSTVVKEVASHFKKKHLLKYNIDDVVPLVNMSGCAQSTGYGYQVLNRTLAGWMENANVVGSVVIGLGCEVVTIDSIVKRLSPDKKYDKRAIAFLNIQDFGGTKNAVGAGIKKVEDMLACLPKFRRIKLPVGLLKVALKCGGSDAASSITANPALGIASDMLISRGGTAVMGEIPECYGAESYLIARCRRAADKKRLKNIFSWWDDYSKKHGVTMNDNISPGNIEGGISTVLEKNLGAVSKGGAASINQVLDYAERASMRGLVLMNTPGFDPVAVTGMVAGGCNIVAFTTGRGSVYGCAIAPTIKISSNSRLFYRLKDDMDIDAGNALDMNGLMAAGKNIYRFILEAASGHKTCSEINGLGKEEFVPWQVGETL